MTEFIICSNCATGIVETSVNEKEQTVTLKCLMCGNVRTYDRSFDRYKKMREKYEELARKELKESLRMNDESE